MEYSLIVPHHGNQRLLGFCLDSLRRTVPNDAEIIVVLNNSDQREISIDIDEGRFTAIRIKENLGYGEAINVGARAAHGKQLVFCDNDTFYLPDWFETLAEFFLTKKNIGAASAKLLNPYNGRIVDYGIAFTKYNAPHPFMDRHSNHPLTTSARQCQAMCAAVFMINRDFFFDLGAFPADRHSYYNDIGLCLDISKAGRDCWIVADSVVYHKSSFFGVQAAPYKESALKGDQKAQFMVTHGKDIVIDMNRYLAESFAAFLLGNAAEPGYIVIDMTNIMDRQWYHAEIRKFLNVLDVYELPTYNRDATAISLMDHLGSNILTLNIPLIYFVDRFIALRHNHLWSRLRPRITDLVIDRNANVDLFVNIAGA